MAKVELKVTHDDGEVFEFSYNDADVIIDMIYDNEAEHPKPLMGFKTTIISGVE